MSAEHIDLHSAYLAAANDLAVLETEVEAAIAQAQAKLIEGRNRVDAALAAFTAKVPANVEWTTEPNPTPHQKIVDGRITVVTPTFLGALPDVGDATASLPSAPAGELDVPATTPA